MATDSNPVTARRWTKRAGIAAGVFGIFVALIVEAKVIVLLADGYRASIVRDVTEAIVNAKR